MQRHGISISRQLASLFAVGVLATPAGSLFAATVTIDGQTVTPVISRGGHLFVPFRAPMERVGAVVGWSSPTATAKYRGSQLVTVNLGDRTEILKGTRHTLSAAPVLIRESAFVPVEALADMCGAKLAYSSDRQSATVTGCTLAGVNSVVAAEAPAAPAVAAPSVAVAPPQAPSFNVWPWLLALLALAALAALWFSRRTKTVYTTNSYSPLADTVAGSQVGASDYAARLQRALSGMDDTRRSVFVQKLSQMLSDSSTKLPEPLLQSTKGTLDAARTTGSVAAVSAAIAQLRDQPQLLLAAARSFANSYPGELGSLTDGLASGAR